MAIFLVFGKLSLFSRPFSCSRRNLPYPDRCRHPEIGKGVEDRGRDMSFGDLPLEGPGVRSVAQWLQPVHPVLGDAAPVVAALVLPATASLGFDLLEDRITGMIVSPSDGAFPRGEGWHERSARRWPRGSRGCRRRHRPIPGRSRLRSSRADRAGSRCRSTRPWSLQCR